MRTLAWLSGLVLAQSKLVIYSATEDPFSFYLDGHWIAEEPTTRAEVDHLTPGPHKASIKVYPQRGGVIQLTPVLYTEEGHISEYFIKKDKKGRYVVRFANQTPLPPEEPPMTTFPPPPSATPPDPTVPSTNAQNQTVVFNPTIQINVGGNPSNVQGGPPTPTTNAPAPTPSPLPPPPYPRNCLTPISRESFQNAYQVISSKTFENTKLDALKQITRSNCLLAADIRDLAKLLDFEPSKLDYTKFAYDYCYDVQNYFQVYEVFDFETSIQELNSYIENRPPKYPPVTTAPAAPSSTPGLAPPGMPCTTPMTPPAFKEALATIRKNFAQEARVQMARQILQSNCLKADQVRDMLKLFYMEKDRLELAKFAYDYCADPQNYHVVNQAFYQSSSVAELSQYIQARRR
ncbi:MAG: DUF4476 domain-containing protein [Bacteroidia bacterium]